MKSALIRRGEDTDTQGKGHVKMEAGTEVMLPQAKHLEAPEAGRDKAGFSPRT